MRARILRSILPLGAALVAVASVAQAQPGARLLVCRDGTQLVSRTDRACTAHRGVDVRATEYARQQHVGAYDNRYNNGQYNGGQYNNGQYNNGQYDHDGASRRHTEAVAAERRAELERRREARLHAERRDDQYGRPHDR